MRVRRAEHVRASGVDRRVNHEGRGIEEPMWPRLIEDVARMVNEDKIGGLDEREVEALM